MVMGWEDDFLETFYKISGSIPLFTRIFVESKHRQASDRRKANSSGGWAANSEFLQWALAWALHPEASRNSWYTLLTLLICILCEEVVDVNSNRVACANSAPPDHPFYIENGQFIRQHRNNKCSVFKTEKGWMRYFKIFFLVCSCVPNIQAMN